jgi:hypothetical protein
MAKEVLKIPRMMAMKKDNEFPFPYDPPVFS